MKITNSSIKKFISDRYGDVIEYDGVKIERKVRHGKWHVVDVKIVSFGRKIGWFEGHDEEDFFDKMKIHFDWQFGV